MTIIPAALREHRSFVRLWWCRLFSVAAQQMLLLAVGWRMAQLTGSPLDLGFVGLLQFAPSLPLALVAGHVADRYHRGRLLGACYAAQVMVSLGLTLLMLAALPVASERTVLFAISIVLGVIRSFQMPAQQAIVPLLVPPGLLPTALAFSSTGVQAAIIAGPALGGFAYAVGASFAFAACGAMLALATGLALSVRHPHQPSATAATLSSLFAGLRYVRGNQALLGAISLDLVAVLLGGATALLPLVVKQQYGSNVDVLGFLRAAPAVGALVTSIFLVQMPIARHAGHKMFASVVVFGAATMLFGYATHFVVAILALLLIGAADMVSVVIRQSLMQIETPNEMRGRVGAITSLFIGASNQLGEFESGLVANWFGVTNAIVFGGAAAIVSAAIWWKLFPALAKRDALVAG